NAHPSPGTMSKSTSLNGSDSEFEFVETPKATPPSFDKEEDCGVRTTKVCLLIGLAQSPIVLGYASGSAAASIPSSIRRMLPAPPAAVSGHQECAPARRRPALRQLRQHGALLPPHRCSPVRDMEARRRLQDLHLLRPDPRRPSSCWLL